MSQGLDRVRHAARQRKKEKFTALLPHLTIDLLRDAFLALKRHAAPGVDGVAWKDYEAGLEDNLLDLHERVHRGTYRALPVRRRFIPKPGGKQRPLGIAALEDKIVQRATVTVLNAIYEEDFLGFSYGFRPGRSQHDALDALSVAISGTPVNWILDADIRGFFDSVSQAWLVRFLEHRIGDERVIRLVRKWLKAGVLEDGEWSVGEKGTPQGAVASPLLANVYLHYVFDLWAQQWRRREATGNVVVVRYAATSWQASSTKPMRGASGVRCVRGSSSSRSSFMRRRRVCWSSAAMRRCGASGEGLANRRPSPSWGSRSSAASLGAGRSSSNARHEETACERRFGSSRCN